MKYKKFIIRDYRAITGPLEIAVENKSLTPIVGVNESGKTTILHALFAFDHYNDQLNDSGRQLKDTANLYRASSPPGTIEAHISILKSEIDRVIWQLEKATPTLKPQLDHVKKRRGFPTDIVITRDVKSLKYTIDSNKFGPADVQDQIARGIIGYLPYILFFDDFRDKIDERIEIVAAQEQSPTGWLSIIQQLFRTTDKSFSVFALPKLEERQRKTVLARVQRQLNETLTREWQNFSLDDRDALKISIDFYTEAVQGGAPRHYLKLDVVETDTKGDEHFFFISDRSKGFYWFFNFVMKLEFNPKIVSDTAATIYLLDEPGSYLHAFAQRKLCLKLRQLSEKNRVIYCTHSHYLLDPDSIPVSSIAVALKDGNGTVKLVPMTEYKGAVSEKRSALQPVLDALQIKPFALDLISTRSTIITEGIYDYFSLELFRGNRPVSILPSVGADSIKFYVSLLLAWQVDFRALWDNDPEGRRKYNEASELFGEEIARRFFRLLPTEQVGTKRIMQDLYDGQDIVSIRSALGLSDSCSFERTIHSLFYSSRRSELVQGVSPKTKQQFECLYDSLSLA